MTIELYQISGGQRSVHSRHCGRKPRLNLQSAFITVSG